MCKGERRQGSDILYNSGLGFQGTLFGWAADFLAPDQATLDKEQDWHTWAASWLAPDAEVDTSAGGVIQAQAAKQTETVAVQQVGPQSLIEVSQPAARHSLLAA